MATTTFSAKRCFPAAPHCQVPALAGGPGQLQIGPFRAQTHLLPHWVPNVGLRLAAGETVLAYTGDCGPSTLVAELARQADLLLAEASYIDLVPEDSRRYLSSAAQAGRRAAQARMSGRPQARTGGGQVPPAGETVRELLP